MPDTVVQLIHDEEAAKLGMRPGDEAKLRDGRNVLFVERIMSADELEDFYRVRGIVAGMYGKGKKR